MSDLDWRVCSRARLTRDARFDGKFFIGVRGSGVYCRPICPVPTAKEKNCTYFATAAAAAEAGYRPCLRCRPESSPGTPAWLGTSTTVSRALRLIDESGLEEGGIEGLAARLGVGTRHLRRLFLKHLGATPNAIAQTRRVHFAKKLIDETSLPMTELAIAAGYGSVRRFNAAIRSTYHRTPTQIRAIARQTKPLPENHYLFRLRFRPPYDWQAVLSFLAGAAIPGIETVDGTAVPPHHHARRKRRCHRNIARCQASGASGADTVWRASHALFHRRTYSGAVRSGCWNGFELTVRAILDRGSPDSPAIAGRIVRMFGRQFVAGQGLTHLFPEAAVLADADLVAAGASPSCSRSIRAVASAARSGELAFNRLAESRAFVAALRKIADIDESTAQYVAMRALGEPDIFPIRNRALKSASQSWCPWRAYAAMYLWDESRGAASRGRVS